METKPGDRKQATRQRRKAAGLVQLEVWCLPDDVARIKKIEAKAVAYANKVNPPPK
jgi:hypothetical protein